MMPHKLTVKVGAPRFQPLDSARVLESFHTWISESALPEILVDAADYRHMRNGPGIVLVGHESNYYFGEHSGQFALSCFRKRSSNDGMHALGDVLVRVLRACELLQQSLSESTDMFDTSTLDVSIADRLVTKLSTFNMGDFLVWVQEYLERIYECAPSIHVSMGAGLPTVRAQCSPRPLHALRARAQEHLS